MNGTFVVLINGVLETYSHYDDIPQVFDNLIQFEPDYPDEPHTEEQHEEVEQYNQKLKDLMKRETNGR